MPIVGSIPGAIAQAGSAGATTYALGHLFRKHFMEDGSLRELDVSASRGLYDSMLERGYAFAASLRRPGASVAEIASEIERLARLRSDGALTDAEFEYLKGVSISAGA